MVRAKGGGGGVVAVRGGTGAVQGLWGLGRVQDKGSAPFAVPGHSPQREQQSNGDHSNTMFLKTQFDDWKLTKYSLSKKVL